MIERIRQPGAAPRDRDHGPAVARVHVNYFALAGTYVYGAQGDETVRQAKPVSMDPKAVALREASQRYRDRRRAS